MEQKVRIKYKHPAKEGEELEVVGWVYSVDDTTTFVKRIDGYSIDIPTANILSQDVLM